MLDPRKGQNTFTWTSQSSAYLPCHWHAPTSQAWDTQCKPQNTGESFPVSLRLSLSSVSWGWCGWLIHLFILVKRHVPVLLTCFCPLVSTADSVCTLAPPHTHTLPLPEGHSNSCLWSFQQTLLAFLTPTSEVSLNSAIAPWTCLHSIYTHTESDVLHADWCVNMRVSISD